MHRLFQRFALSLVSLFLLMGGGCLALLPFSQKIRNLPIYLIEHHYTLLFFFGCLLVFIGATLLFSLIKENSSKLLHLKKGEMAVDVEVEVVKKIVTNALKRHFSEGTIPVDVRIHKGKAHLEIDLP